VVSSGVVIKCPTSNFEAHTQKTYIRSEEQGIVLDAGKGKGPLLISCKTVMAAVRNQAVIACGTDLSDGSKPSATHIFSASFSTIDSRLRIGGTTTISSKGFAPSLVVQGNMAAGGTVAGKNSHLAKTDDKFNKSIAESGNRFDESLDNVVNTIEEQNDDFI